MQAPEAVAAVRGLAVRLPGHRPHARRARISTPRRSAHAWAELRIAAKLEDVRLYDACRHRFASVAVSQHGLSLAQIGEQLGHSQPATTQRYAHLHDDVAKRNATAIGGSMRAALRKRPGTMTRRRRSTYELMSRCRA